MNAHQSPIHTALRRGVAVLAASQTEAGSWKGDYSGPLFLPPMWVGAHHILGRPLQGDEADKWVAYLRGVQRSDGSWGLGVENPGSVFTTVNNYVAMRLLGVPAHDPDVLRARAWFEPRGGPTRSASWGRFFLALLGLYDWSGIDPVPPETWLLPYRTPVHPGRMWCHARMVYLPMSWLYAKRCVGPITQTIVELRSELYPKGYDRVNWRAHRGRVAPEDAHTPRTRTARLVHGALSAIEPWWPRRLRARATDEVLRQIRYEDEITAYRNIGPVSKIYNLLVWHFERPGGDALARHLRVLPVYRWEDGRGARMNGYDSSELWDTAFATQALHATGLPEAFDVLRRAHDYVDQTQVLEDPPDAHDHYRCRSMGAWPFSTREHGWPITDCTAEGILASLAAGPHVEAPLGHDRLALAADRLLDWQNTDGSWASYERTRGPRWLEWLNPSDAFGEIMIDHGHVECTAASMKGLAAFAKAFPSDVRSASIRFALARGRDFLLRTQRADGGWLGGWAVCFTYGTWFGITGLRAAGVPADDPAITRAVAFLRSIQRPDGAWGEHVEACRLKTPVPTERGQPVQTAWAVLALLAADKGHEAGTRRGVQWLLDHQRGDGTWHQEHVTGVFNRTCAIHYDAYPMIFPLWALAHARATTIRT